MGSEQSRRQARESQRKNTFRKRLGLGGVGLIMLSGGILVFNLAGSQPQPGPTQAIPSACTTTQRVTVSATKAMAQVLEKIPVDGADCISLSVTDTANTAEVAHQIVSGKSAPNLWIPDSSLRAELTLAGEANVITKADSLAKTPSVIVSSSKNKKTYSSWNACVADASKVSMGDPKTDSGAFFSLINSTAEVTEGIAPASELTASTALRAQTIGAEEAAPSPQEQLDAVASGHKESAVVTEADYITYLSSRPEAALTAYVPKSGTDELNYPMYQPTTGSGTNKTIGTAADKITQFLKSDQGKKALEEAGLRGSDGKELANSPLGTPSPLNATDSTVLAEMWTSYTVQSRPLNASIILDSSASMAQTYSPEGVTRMQVIQEAAQSGIKQFKSRDTASLWFFASKKSSKDGQEELEYRQLLPGRQLSDQVDGKDQQQLLLDSIKDVNPIPGSNTDLHQAILKAFRNTKGELATDATNVAIILTDGDEAQQPTPPAAELISTIQREQDPNNPDVIVIIGITEDADMATLQNIATKVGGRAYAASSAQDIQTIFYEALAVNSPEANDPAMAGSSDPAATGAEAGLTDTSSLAG